MLRSLLTHYAHVCATFWLTCEHTGAGPCFTVSVLWGLPVWSCGVVWQLHVQLLGGPVLIQGRCPPPSYTGWEVVQALGRAQTAALGAPGLLPLSGSQIPRLPIPGRHRRAPGPRGQGEWRLSHLFGWAGVCSLPGLLLLCRTGGGAKCPWPQSAQICVTGGLGRGAGPGNGGSSAAPPRAPTPKTTVAETAEWLGAARAPGR